MPVHNPVILLTFANPLAVPESYLSSLNREASVIYKHLIPYEIDDRCNLDQLNNASIDQVFNAVEAWNKSKEIILFHYGGHAEGGALMLTTNQGDIYEAKATGLAKLLGSISSLQLVFLNGCSTQAQVKLLLDNGVKAVIATSEPINDKMAVDFADRFYKNLSEGSTLELAFKQAQIFVETKYDYLVQAPSSYRKMDFSRPAKDGNKLPWGLYYHPDFEKVLNWRLPQKKQEKTSYSIRDKYTCDRSEQNSRFRTEFIKNRSTEKFQFYVIHGEERQSPNGLFQRFVLEHIAPTYERYFHKIVTQEEASNLEDTKMNAIAAFFKAMELNPNHFPGELNIRTIANSKIAKEMDCIVLMFRIYSSEWKPFTRAYLNWVIKEFCDSSQLPLNSPDFIVFTNVVYDEEKKKGGLLSRFVKASHADKARKTINSFVKIAALPELPPVYKKDIRKWLDRMTEDPDEKVSIIDLHFSDKQEEMSMNRVEKKLEKIIEEFNKQ